jgi:hypothetical protein
MPLTAIFLSQAGRRAWAIIVPMQGSPVLPIARGGRHAPRAKITQPRLSIGFHLLRTFSLGWKCRELP